MLDWTGARRLWISICEYLPGKDIELGLRLTCRKLKSLLDDAEIWNVKLDDLLWHKDREIFIAGPKTMLKLLYMKSKRSFCFIGGRHSVVSYDIKRSTMLVHCYGLPDFDENKLCFLRNGDLIGKEEYFGIQRFYILEANSLTLAALPPPLNKHINKGVLVARQDCIYYIRESTCDWFDLRTWRWSSTQWKLTGEPLAALSRSETLYVVLQTGVSVMNFETGKRRFLLYDQENCKFTTYLGSFLCDSDVVILTTFYVIVASPRALRSTQVRNDRIPLNSKSVHEDDQFVYFGQGKQIFRYEKKSSRIEPYYIGQVDFSFSQQVKGRN